MKVIAKSKFYIYVFACYNTWLQGVLWMWSYDSYGNTCDEDNADNKIENVTLSGLNLKGKPYVSL
jgi:hypothetical protein